MEQRVIAFAEQLGRIVGTVQAKAEGWMDREALNKQIASVRDSASELLEQLSGSVTSLTNAASKATGIGADASAASTPSNELRAAARDAAAASSTRRARSIGSRRRRIRAR